jgi:hypothetical protein
LVQVLRDPAILDAWTQDTRSPDGSFIRQSIVQQPVEAPKRLVVVVDGSQVMNSFLDQIVAGLEEVDTTLPTTVLAASDGVVALREPGASERSGPASPANSVRLLRALGGQDNVPALIEAHELASKTPGSVVLWIHAPQPMLLSSPDPLLQACERNPNGPSIYEIQTEVGADAVINKLNGLGSLHSIPRLGSLEDDLQRLFNSWSGQASQPAYERRAVSSAVEAQAGNAIETSLQIARLWALDQVRPLRATRKVVEAVKLAALYQLVTPVSGAVVLENAQQYQETGLKPVDPQTVPSVPEPSTFALFLLAGGALLVMRRSRRRLQRCC